MQAPVLVKNLVAAALRQARSGLKRHVLPQLCWHGMLRGRV
jgi:hypothetical protein